MQAWLNKWFGIPDYDETGRLLPGNPEIKMWLDENLTGKRIADLRSIRRTFDLQLAHAVALLNAYEAARKKR